MFSFFARLFRIHKEKQLDLDAVVEEHWHTFFTKKEKIRFELVKEKFYTSILTDKGLEILLDKKHLFAWTLNPYYRYRDFFLEADIFFPKHKKKENLLTIDSDQAGSEASGFLFRYISETNFYSILISDKGFVRMDAVFNGNPLPILGWTEIPNQTANISTFQKQSSTDVKSEEKHSFALKIICRATSFTIILNDSWIAEIQDDTIQSPGKIAFAGQNWGKKAKAHAILTSFAIDSRPFEIEAMHSRWNDYIQIPLASRKNLARTWYAMGSYIPALLEMQKVKRFAELSLDDAILLTQMYSAQGLYQEAEQEIQSIIQKYPNSIEAKSELAGLLYLQNKYDSLECFLNTIEPEQIEISSFLLTMQGHLFSRKEEFLKAAKAYEQAALLSPHQGLFFLNAGNEYAKAATITTHNADENKKNTYIHTACTHWLKAGNIFLNQELYADLEDVFLKLKPLIQKNSNRDNSIQAQFLALKGKYAYAQEDEKKAKTLLLESIKTAPDFEDSAVFYLCGLLASKNGNRDESIAFLKKAYNCKPEYPLYAFRLAETLFYAGKDCTKELEHAMALDSENGWIFNLASLKALSENNIGEAQKFNAQALELLPNEDCVLINYAEILRRQDRLDEVLSMLDTGRGDLLHAAANLLVADARYEEADQWYIKALKKSPHKIDLLIDRATNCIELNLINEADDLLGKAFEIELSPRLYRLIAYLACIKGEFSRAEVALLEAREQYPKNLDIIYDLGWHWIQLNKQEKLKKIINQLEQAGDETRAGELRFENEYRHYQSFSCSSCARKWWVPKQLPPQAALRIQDEPPNDLPAGTCSGCEALYCIECAKAHLDDDLRFRCAVCGDSLKLKDPRVIYVLNEWLGNK